MTAEQIREFLRGFRAKVSFVEVTQTPEQIAQMIEIWLPYRPADLIWDDANQSILLEHCLCWHHGYVDLLGLSNSSDAHYGSQELRRHVPPQTAPVIVEPLAPQKKLEGRDSLGSGATSVEKPISSVVSSSHEASESHAFEDAADYCYSEKFGGSNYRNKCKQLRLQAWRETPRMANGLINKAEIARRYKELKGELDRSIAPSKDNANYLQEVADKERHHCLENGLTDSTTILQRIEAAVREAQASLKK